MSTEFFPWGAAVAIMLFSIPVAFAMDQILHEKVAGLKPYKWGYYTGLTGLLGWIAYAMHLFEAAMHAYDNRSEKLAIIGGVLCIGLAAANFFIIRRNRWGWIIGTISQLNPILWIINGIYMKNRWVELSGISTTPINRLFQSLPFAYRLLIAGAFFWGLLVLMFLFTFEPYGGHVSDSEWWQAFKIIVFPPMASFTGYWIFIKLVLPSKKQN